MAVGSWDSGAGVIYPQAGGLLWEAAHAFTEAFVPSLECKEEHMAGQVGS